MNRKTFYTDSTHTIWVGSLQANWHIYFPAQPRCSLLNRMTIPLRRALLDRQINAPLDLFNYGFKVKFRCNNGSVKARGSGYQEIKPGMALDQQERAANSYEVALRWLNISPLKKDSICAIFFA